MYTWDWVSPRSSRIEQVFLEFFLLNIFLEISFINEQIQLKGFKHKFNAIHAKIALPYLQQYP